LKGKQGFTIETFNFIFLHCDEPRLFKIRFFFQKFDYYLYKINCGKFHFAPNFILI